MRESLCRCLGFGINLLFENVVSDSLTERKCSNINRLRVEIVEKLVVKWELFSLTLNELICIA